MSNKQINEVIREIKDHTNQVCGKDPQSFAPVAAKAAIALLEDMRS